MSSIFLDLGGGTRQVNDLTYLVPTDCLMSSITPTHCNNDGGKMPVAMAMSFCDMLLLSTHAEHFGVPWLQLLFRCKGFFHGSGNQEGGDPSGCYSGALH